MKGALVVACALLVGSPAVAQQPSQPMGLGFGMMHGGCGEYARAPENSIADVAFGSWILGYLSGLNVAKAAMTNYSVTVDVTGGRPNASSLLWVRNWCLAHPLAEVSEAMSPLLEELLK
jgi:hypothetical protein